MKKLNLIEATVKALEGKLFEDQEGKSFSKNDLKEAFDVMTKINDNCDSELSKLNVKIEHTQSPQIRGYKDGYYISPIEKEIEIDGLIYRLSIDIFNVFNTKFNPELHFRFGGYRTDTSHDITIVAAEKLLELTKTANKLIEEAGQLLSGIGIN